MLGSTALNARRWDGVQLSIVLLLLLSVSAATSAGTAPSPHQQQAKGIHATASDGGPDNGEAVSSSGLSPAKLSKGTAEVQMFDFSFSQSCPYPAAAATRAEEDDEDQVEQDLQRSRPARALSLRECSLGDAGLTEIARSPWVRGRTAARALSLRSNQITAVGARALLESLRLPLDSGCRENLAFLELDFNPLGDAGIQRLPAYLVERAGREGGGLEELSLRFCDIGPTGCRYLASALVKAAAAAPTATETSAKARASGDRSPLDVDETSAAAAATAEDVGGDAGPVSPPPIASGIRRLLLAGNHRLSDAGARALASALKKDRTLEVLDLTRCKIGDEGARCLAEALRSNSSLRELRLGYNDISADGASALASLLHTASGALETLELQGNHIGDAGAIALANGLTGRGVWEVKRGGGRRDVRRATREGSGGLRSLNLAGNGIGCAGGVALAEALSGEGVRGRGRRGRGGRGGGGGFGVVLEELELAGNPLTLSAAQAAQAKKNSSLYKSAGGALTSLLNTFVDESYYSSGGGGKQHASASSSSSPNDMNTNNSGGAGGPSRCAVAELGRALAGGRRGGGGGDYSPSLKVVGLARTGMTDGDASRLARRLRARPASSPLEEVEVGMNGLSERAADAVHLAVESPTPPQDLADSDDSEEEGRESWEDQQQQQQPQPQRRRRQKGRRPEGRKSAAPGRTAGPSQPRSSEGGGGGGGGGTGKAAAGTEERAASGQVGEFVPPGGSVELGMFGKKFASFRQERGSGGELEVDVFGKRVRFERTAGSSQSRSCRPSPSAPSTATSPPSSPEMDDSDPWSDEEDEDDSDSDDFGAGIDAGLSGVSDAATHGSSSWSDEDGGGSGSSDAGGSGGDTYDGDSDDDYDDEEEEEEQDEEDDDDDEWQGGETSRRTSRSPKVFSMRGGGGGGGGGSESCPGRTNGSRRRHRDEAEGDGKVDDNSHKNSKYITEWGKSSGRRVFGGNSNRVAVVRGGGSGAASTDLTEWESGFDDDGSDDDVEWTAGFELSESEKKTPLRASFSWSFRRAASSRDGDCRSGRDAGVASADETEWEAGFDDDGCSDEGEWAAGFESTVS